MSSTAAITPENCFVEVRTSAYTFTDTVSIYMANNIFHGNGSTAFLKCNDEFSVYADYNVVFNFSSYVSGESNILGTAHDILTDPLYIDDFLHIDGSSPAIDRGADGTIFPGVPDEDFSGVIRPQGAGIDIGAYEQ